jgi:hypothetical protein
LELFFKEKAFIRNYFCFSKVDIYINKNRKTLKTMKNSKKKSIIQRFVDASGKAVREIAIANGEGFKSNTKVYKNKNKYSRKLKHKKI